MTIRARNLHVLSTNYRLGIAGFRELLSYAASQGLARDICLQGTGVSTALLSDPDAEIEASQELELIRRVCGLLGNDFRLGLAVGRAQHLSALGVLGLGIMSAANGRDAAEWGARFVTAGFPLLRYQWKVGNAEHSLLILDDHLPEDVIPFLLGRDLATAYNIHHDLLPEHPIGISAIELALPWQPGMEQVEALFGCEVQVNRGVTRLVLRSDILQLGFSQANPFTRAQCERRCQELLDRRRATASLASEFRGFLQRNGNLRCSFREVAEALNLSERNARRRLREEGTGWRQLRENILIDSARARLAAGETIPRVAEALGYTEASSFSHAFKRWTGLSPAQFCQAHGTRPVKPGKEPVIDCGA